ncbi:MAG TPA: hypothetical protein VE444_05225 [Gaiellaceae bacterium]|nr:hypothetical protein [Gaiellaceae bacterium]
MIRSCLIVAAALALAVPAGAAEAPSISANPDFVGNNLTFQLQGTVPSAGAGESVRIEAKECRGTFFRTYAGTTTQSGGAWHYDGFLEVTTEFRARWKYSVSAPIVVRKRMSLSLHKRGGGVFIGGAVSRYQPVGGRTVKLERFTERGWVLVRAAKLRSQGPQYGTARFVVRTKKLQLRLTMDQSTAGPCYAAGVSPIVRS